MNMEQIIIEQEWWDLRFDSECEEYQELLKGAAPLQEDGFTEFDSLEELLEYENYI